MNIIFSILLVFFIILLLAIFAAWIGKFNVTEKLAFIDRKSTRLNSSH